MISIQQLFWIQPGALAWGGGLSRDVQSLSSFSCKNIKLWKGNIKAVGKDITLKQVKEKQYHKLYDIMAVLKVLEWGKGAKNLGKKKKEKNRGWEE